MVVADACCLLLLEPAGSTVKASSPTAPSTAFMCLLCRGGGPPGCCEQAVHGPCCLPPWPFALFVATLSKPPNVSLPSTLKQWENLEWEPLWLWSGLFSCALELRVHNGLPMPRTGTCLKKAAHTHRIGPRSSPSTGECKEQQHGDSVRD